MEKDLTQGNERRVLWLYSLPLLGSILFQQLYNIVDSLVAGKFISDGALAAVGNSYEITLIFLAFAFGVNVGAGVIVSRLFGAKRYGDMKTAVSTTMLLGGTVCALLMLAGFLGTETLLKLIDTPLSVFDDCKLYLYIYIAGLPFLFFYNISTGIFSAMGDSLTPLIFLACSSVANVLVDILFVAGLNMGVAGVAWATFLCQGVSCVLALITVILRLKRIGAGERGKLFSAAILKDILFVAVPSILQQLFISVGNIVIQRAINGFGESTMAGYAAAIKLNNLVITSFTTLATGMSSFASQNIGARQYGRVKKGYRWGVVLIAIVALPVTVLYFFGGKLLLGLFMQDLGGAAMEEGLLILRILSPFYLLVGAKIMTDGVMRGAGKMWQFMAATFSDLVLRVVLAFVLSNALSSSLGIWLAWPIGWFVAFAISFGSYLFLKLDKGK